MKYSFYLSLLLIFILSLECSVTGIEYYFSPSGEGLKESRQGFIPEFPKPISGPADHINITRENIEIELFVYQYKSKLVSIGPAFFPIIPLPLGWFNDINFGDGKIKVHFEFKPNGKEIKWNTSKLYIKLDDMKNPIFCDSISTFYRHNLQKSSEITISDSSNKSVVAQFNFKTEMIRSFVLYIDGIEIENEKIYFPHVNFIRSKGWVYSMGP